MTTNTPDTKTSDAEAPVPLKDQEFVTQHDVQVDGQSIPYTAKIGRLVLHDNAEQSRPKLAMSYTAYFRTGLDSVRDRPVMFLFNGGPGSSSAWLHMLSIGPRRIVFQTDPLIDTSRWELQANEYALIDAADLVFVDAPSTGFGRAAPGEDPKQFFGVDADAAAFGDFIAEFLLREGRLDSPTVLAGESYGTIRAPAIAHYLHSHRFIHVDGIALIASIMDLAGVAFEVGVNLGAIGYLPAYAATALYHGVIEGDLENLVAQAEQFALEEYSVALLKGTRLSSAERNRVAGRLSELTGIKKDFIVRSNLRIPLHRYVKELLRDRRRTVGRLDGRWVGIDTDAAGETFEYDPSITMIGDPTTRAVSDYMRQDLGWESDRPMNYRLFADVMPWKHRGAESTHGMWTPHLEVATLLKGAMNRAPHMKVLVQSGYYDFATPYFAAELTFEHLCFEPERSENITMKRYEGGHMMYLHIPSLAQMRGDLLTFLGSLRP